MVHWMPGHEHLGPPSGWAVEHGEAYCLACCRELAGEAVASAAPSGTPILRRAQLRHDARIDFELRRDPGRSNSEIARVMGTSVPAVVKARARLSAGENGAAVTQ